MNVQPIRRRPSEIAAEWIALGVFEGETEPPANVSGTPLGEVLVPLLASKDVSADLGATTPLFARTGRGGRARCPSSASGRECESFGAGEAYPRRGSLSAERLSGKKRGRVAVCLPEVRNDRGSPSPSALTEGVVVGVRGPDLRKTEPSRYPFETLGIVLPIEARRRLEARASRGSIVGESINLARDLANTPPAEKPPTRLAERAREVATADGIGVEVWDRARIERERFGGLIGVAAGSDEPPAFVVLDYPGGGDAPTLALVGKGVTFDSGGLCLKPPGSMEDMKCDMTGAAVVLATMVAAARLQLPVNLAGYMALTENMTGGKAMKMGDVLTIRNGKTIEVLNTDAEGRLILADALSYAVESKPDRILDLATLTGACVIALGTKVAGLFANDDPFSDDVLDACRATGERAWRLPLDSDYLELIKSHVADLKNVGGKWGGAISAAKFLQQFVGETPWVHLDIAGPSWSDTENSTRDAGGTGCFVRTLVALVESGGPLNVPGVTAGSANQWGNRVATARNRREDGR